MHGLMMDSPLSTSSLIVYAARQHGDTEIVSRSVEGPIHRTTYRAVSGRAFQGLPPADGVTRSRPATKIAPKPTAVKRVNIKDCWF